MRNSKIFLFIFAVITLVSCGASKRVAGNRYVFSSKNRVVGGSFTFNYDCTFDFDYRAMCFEHRWNHGTWTPIYKTGRNHNPVISRRRSVRSRRKYDKVMLNFIRHDNIPLKVAEYYQPALEYKMIILPKESFYNIPVWVIVNGEAVNVSSSEREEHVLRLSAAKFPKIESIAVKSDLRLHDVIWEDVKHHGIKTEVYEVKNPDNNIFCISLPQEKGIRCFFDLQEFRDTVVHVKRNAICFSGGKLRKK